LVARGAGGGKKSQFSLAPTNADGEGSCADEDCLYQDESTQNEHPGGRVAAPLIGVPGVRRERWFKLRQFGTVGQSDQPVGDRVAG
jgi:hypothetical protein